MNSQWERFDRYFLRYPDLHFSLDISRVHFDGSYFETMGASVAKAFRSMEALEKGAIANPDEKRMVGRYWLRAPELAPNDEVRHLQQLVMESLGKEFDLDGTTVHQGIAVYGNKGSTDQHAYVQQLRDGAGFSRHLGESPSADRFVWKR